MAEEQPPPTPEHVASTLVHLYAWRVTVAPRFAATATMMFCLFVVIFSPAGIVTLPVMIAAMVVLGYYNRQTNRLIDQMTPVLVPYTTGVTPKTTMELLPALSTRPPKGWLAAPDTETAARWFKSAVNATFTPPEGQTNCASGHYPGCPHRRPKEWVTLLADPAEGTP